MAAQDPNSLESKLGCISICPPEVKTRFEDLASVRSDAATSDRFIVEFGYPKTQIMVTEGQRIKMNDMIATMKGIAVKSKIIGTVTEVHENYIIGKYETDVSKMVGISENSTQQEIEDLVSKDDMNISDLNEIMQRTTQAEMFIKDYILYFRQADIACNYLTHVSPTTSYTGNTTSRICNSYRNAAKSLSEKYNESLMDVCGADNVQQYCENNDMMGLKAEIDSRKKQFYGKIMYMYNNVNDFGYNKGTIMDQMLFDEYLDYITGEDFYYDDSNPYVVELMHHLTSFLQIRSRLEYNATNIKSLITKFNALCDDTIKKYWKSESYDYYRRLKTIFQYDFYADDENDLIQAKIDDKNRTTLYSKVLKYLETLCKYVPPASLADKYKSMDMETIIKNPNVEESPEDAEMKNLYNRLMKISISFVQVRRVENDIDEEYLTSYIDEEEYDELLEAATELTENSKSTSINELVKKWEHEEITRALNTSNQYDGQVSTFERKYLDPFLILSKNESKILRELADKAISYYNKHINQIESGELFDKYKEANWGGKNKVYKDNIPHDFYFIDEPLTIKEEKEKELPIYPENSHLTACGVNEYNYWLRYCTIATIVNCTMPSYWATGIVIDGAPIPMPIIYIPYTVLYGRVTVVIGVGICGICTLPMLLFVNLGNIPGSLMPALNMLIDMMKMLCKLIMSKADQSSKLSANMLITMQDQIINQLKLEKSNLENQIYILKSGVETDKETLRNLRKKLKKDPTSNSNEDHNCD